MEERAFMGNGGPGHHRVHRGSSGVWVSRVHGIYERDSHSRDSEPDRGPGNRRYHRATYWAGSEQQSGDSESSLYQYGAIAASVVFWIIVIIFVMIT